MKKMSQWEKLSPDEFKTFQEYIAESSKDLITAVKEYVGENEDPKKDAPMNFSDFFRFMSIYVETGIPESLCRRLFVSLLKRPHLSTTSSSAVRNHGFLSKSDSNSLAPTEKGVRRGLHSPTSSISEPTEIRLMSSFIDRQRSILGRKSVDGTTAACTGTISLKDLICCLSLLEAGKPESKLEFLFRLYDADGNGILDSIEIDLIIDQMMTVAKHSGWDVSELKPILQEMMQEVDYDSDGCVTLEEWMKAGSSNIPLMVLLGVDSMFTDEGSHSWELKHFNRPAFCNFCSNLLVGLGKQGLRCIYCKYTVHERCVQKVIENCIATYSKSKVVQSMSHHWVEGNCAGKCDKCKKYVKSYNRLTGRKCRWCKLSVHSKCVVDQECNMGPCWQHVLSPSQISPSVLNRKLKSKSPASDQSNSATSSEDQVNSSFASLQLVPLPDVVPLLVFINPKSGGKQGKTLLKKFQYILNPRQVFNVVSEKGFMTGLQFFKELPDYRVLCCGGDGTVGWLLESMDKMCYSKFRPPVAILPLGTGNDLARSLRWGGGYEGEDLYKKLDQIARSTVVMIDRWNIEVKTTEPTPEADDLKMPCNFINNYFSIGVDASIAHRFHVMREKHPEKFNSRMKNKLLYLEYGTSETLRASCKNLHESVQITCDGVPLDIMHGPSMEGIAMLNIGSIYGGSNLWGDTMKVKKRKKIIGGGSDADREFSSGSMSSTDLSVTVQDMGDKLIEIVGLMNTIHMVKVKGGIHSGERLAQCSTLTIQTLKEFPMQIDGEPWIQPPCTLTIKHENQVPMLMAPRGNKKPNFFGLFSSSSK